MKLKHLITYISIFCLLATSNLLACTRILKNRGAPAVMAGRNMDWHISDSIGANLWVLPRGMQRDGRSDVNPIKWHARYGSIVATVYDEVMPITVDGMNEHGLGAHLNSLRISDYGKRDVNIPGLSVVMWAQYMLDNFKTVNESTNYASSHAFQLTDFTDPITGRSVLLHLAIEDASGDSAIFEYINGQLHIYHDPSYAVMTNRPAYPVQRENRRDYEGFGGRKPIPGTNDSKDRFVRASFHLGFLPRYETVEDELTGVYSVLENVTQPANNMHGDGTVWRAISDLTNRNYYFSNMQGLMLMHTSLKSFNLREGASPMRLVVQKRRDLAGDVTKLFEAAQC